MEQTELNALKEKCRHVRYLIMDQIGKLGVGHVGGSLSAVEALTVVYYRHMKQDPKNPKKEDRDRFVLSKGHAGPAEYAILADKGFFPMEWLDTLNKPGTRLPSHTDMHLTPGVDMTTGSLGQGFSCSVGIALGNRIRKNQAYVYTMVGDGESQEGLIWEAAMFAAHNRLDHLIAFTDRNLKQIDGTTEDVNALEPLVDKWQAFGWSVQRVDGHSLEAIDDAVLAAKAQKGKPSMIILDTVKGKGVSFIENASFNHSLPISPEQREEALKELEGGTDHV